jgi:hypothetical protein
LVNGEFYGDFDDSSRAWAIRFEPLRVEKYKIVSGDGLYREEYQNIEQILRDKFYKNKD